MDVVKALSLYRKSVSDDAAAFEILSFLFKDGATSEPEIERSTGIDPRALKNSLRELYQANFVRLKSEYRFELTFFGEEVLFQMGVGEVVAPFLIGELISAERASWIRQLAELAFNSEPERLRRATQSLRNLRVFLSHHTESSDDLRSIMAFNCISPAESVLGTLLAKNFSNDGKHNLPMLYFAGHGTFQDRGVDATHWLSSLSGLYERFSVVSGDADKFFVDACLGSKLQSDMSDDVARYLSFRVYNYINSNERDSVLEYCYPKAKHTDLGNIFSMIWKNLVSVFSDRGLRSQQDLANALYGAVVEKTKLKLQTQESVGTYFTAILDETKDLQSSESDLLVAIEAHLNEVRRAGSSRPETAHGSQYTYTRIRELLDTLEKSGNVGGAGTMRSSSSDIRSDKAAKTPHARATGRAAGGNAKSPAKKK